MGSSETGGAVVDCSVGSIVWVRRRNGSWWPGKILGPEELSSSHITSPRSGTPVKLLGREDASVDWYNLEKSKRVKAFRCGEFDDCIERAEAAQGMPPKKREKYARREDAILHALELERQLLEKKYGKSGNSSNGRRKMSPDAVTSSEFLENGGRNQKDLRSDPERLDSSLAEKSGTDKQLCEETVREGNQLSGDDDSAGILPRMRGLQDFGLRTTPSTREELSGVALRAKRIRNAYLTYDSGDYLTDNQTLSSQIEIPVSRFDESSYPADVGEDHNSGSTEDTETDCSETDSLESDSDDDMMALSDGSASIELQPKYPRRIEAQEDHGSISSSDDFDELAYGDGLPHPLPHGFVSNSTGVSKWQLKGKRNNRNLGKRYLDRTDAEVSRGYTNGRNSNWSNSGFKADPTDKNFRNHVNQYGSTRLHGSNEVADSDALAWNNHSAMREYWEEPQEYVDPFSVGRRHHFGGRTMMLIDVDLKVQANNYRRDVPMISLMSKLNGHAIIGHPIQIEALESGLSENHTDYFLTEPLEPPATLPSVWRTGRRTANSRVPRPFLSSTLNGESKQQALFVDQDREPAADQGSTRVKGNTVQKSLPQPHQYPMDRKSSRISPKKNSPSSNQKTRMLSAIASEEQHQADPRSDGNNFQVDRLIKTENIPTTVACIPVNLVFSRLHEELVGRHQ